MRSSAAPGVVALPQLTVAPAELSALRELAGATSSAAGPDPSGAARYRVQSAVPHPGLLTSRLRFSGLWGPDLLFRVVLS